MISSNILLPALIFIVLISCNYEEKKIAGEYILDSCNVDTVVNGHKMPQNIILSLNINKTFKTEGKDVYLNGEWIYYDSGDRAIVGLYKENSDFENQLILGTNENGNFLLWVLNPNILFNRDNIKYMRFKSKKKK